jgi:short-subunit dehydrogenase
MTWRDVAGSMGKRALESRRVRKAMYIGGAGVLAAGAGFALAGLGVGLAGWALWRRLGMAGEDVRGQVVLITGSSRGLGFALAQEFASLGAKLVICARHESELEAARAELARAGAEVLAVPCDVTARDQVEQMVRRANERFGRIDILINNAGITTVGPLQAQTLEDFHECMNVLYWGIVHPTLAVLPQMLARRRGHIANITSIGGKIAIPHLLPYSAAKFAAVGFSEGLRSEVLKDGVKVTTVVPGLMRTGSHWNAFFKGDNRAEFTWFSMGATMPLVSLDGRRAARKVVDAVRHGRSEAILSPQARILATVHGVFPGLTSDLMGLVNRALPSNTTKDRYTGKESETAVSRSFLQALGRRAAVRFNQPGGAAGPVIVTR